MDIYYNPITGFIKTVYIDRNAPIGVTPIITINNPPSDLFNTMSVISPNTEKPKYYIVNGNLYEDPNWVAPTPKST